VLDLSTPTQVEHATGGPIGYPRRVAEVVYRIHVHRKTGTSEHVLREGGELVFGREPECSVTLVDGSISRRHAALRLRNGQLEFADLGSRNGSVVDGTTIATNAVLAVRPTSLIRIGNAVVVIEETSSELSAPWCFDRASFEQRAAAALAAASARGALRGLVEICWESAATRTTTTDGATPLGLQQILGKIVGTQGLIGAHETGRILLLLPDTDAERLSASAGLLSRICEEHALDADIRVASSTHAKKLDALLAELSRDGTKQLVPPVFFQGGLRSVDALLQKLDASEAPVLIVGETGVGKDVLARTLHSRSRRAGKPLVALNCAAFSDALFESELFGHERGAFTGANQTKTGLLESAAGGTVFLDEIGEMPLAMQAKLLRVVENREVLRVGALQPRPIDVRFIFATNRDLQQEIEQKAFRADLFFRIGSITLRIPPLRERVDEIAPLTQHFIGAAAKRIGRPEPRLLPETLRLLESHAWPGNVRELKNVIDLAVLVSEGDTVRPSDIHIERFVAADTGLPSSRSPHPPSTELRASPPPADAAPLSGAEQSEKERILEALEKSTWNQSAAAKLLGMPRRTLVKRLGQYDLPRPRKRDA
jgi:DNA-binding NtrC family response regulator